MSNKVKSVMVVDDNDTDLLIARIVIEKTGFEGKIITQNSGRGALEFLKSIESNPVDWPDIIFLDINMPVVNGFVFLGEFDQLPKHISEKTKIAVLTSSDNKTDMEKFFQNKFVFDFVPKPISLEGFTQVLNKYNHG